MPKYTGIITCRMTQDFSIITGEYDFKPSTEPLNDMFGTMCHWFENPYEAIQHIHYLRKMGYHLEVE